MTSTKGIRIYQEGARQAVQLDDTDITSALRGLTVRMGMDQLPQVELDLVVFELQTRTDKAEVHIPAPTRALLIDAGWSPPGAEFTAGTYKIAQERRRQIHVKGRTAEHDDKHARGELVDAALYYADTKSSGLEWPWSELPDSVDDDRVTELAKAGALIAAEIDRLLRAQGGKA